MTVADNTSRNQYTATPSQALFAYTFEIVDKDDIVVLINGTPLSEGTDYTVTGVGSDTGGNIVLTSGTTGGNIVTIYRDMPYSRTQNYTNSGDFLASEVNSDFDNLWLAGEQTNRAFSQSIRKPIIDSDSISMELPKAVDRADTFLTFDSNGAVSVQPVEDGINPATITRDQFTGDGSTTLFTLTSSKGNERSVVIYIDGVYQESDSYNIAGFSLTFTEAPPLNSSIEVLLFKVYDITNIEASDVSVSDAGGYYTSSTVEGALQEVGADIAELDSGNYLNVKEFGAKGDGTTDDTTSIQNAINHASNNEIQTIFFPDGHYKYTTLRFYHDATDNPNFQETPNRDGRFQLRGTGRLSISDLKSVGKSPNRIYGSILESTSGGSGLIVEPTGTFQSTTDARNFVVKDLTLVADNTGYIVTAESCPGLTFDHCSFKQLNHQGNGILARNCWFFTMSQCYVFGQSWIDEEFATAGQTEFSYTFDNPASTSDIIVQKKGGLVSSSDYSINTTTKVVTLNTGADLDDKVSISRKNTGDGISSQFVGSAFGSFAGLWNITESLVDSWANGVHWTGGTVTNLSLRNTGVQNCNNYNIYADDGVIQQMLLDNVYMENQSVQGVSFIKGNGTAPAENKAVIRNLRMINCFMLAGGTFPRVTGTCIDIDNIEVIDIEGMYVFRMRQPFLNITRIKNFQDVPGEIKNSVFTTDQDLSAEPTIYLLSGKIPNVHNCVWPGFNDGFYDTTNDILLFDSTVESNFPRQYTDLKGTTGTAKFGFGDTVYKEFASDHSGPYNITGSTGRTYYNLKHEISTGLKVILPDNGEVNDGRLMIIKNNEQTSSSFPYINVVNNTGQNATLAQLAPGQAGLFIVDVQSQLSTTLTATSGQTDFVWTFNNDSGNVAVKQNGTQLIPSEYSSNNATNTVTLTTGATAGDTIEIYVGTFRYVGRVFSDDLYLSDDQKISLGRSDDLQIFHQSSDSTNRLVSGAANFALPTADGTAGQSIITDGSGNLSFATATGTGINAVVDDTTPQLGGDLASNGNDILFADNDKAIFGAGSDLQIYHDASNSYIYEAGTGSLTLQTDGAKIGIAKASPFEWMLEAETDGAVSLYYDNSKKLATTSTGIDVTGSVTADSATIDGTVSVTGSLTTNQDITISETIPRLVLDDTSATDNIGIIRQANSNLVLQAQGGAGTYGGVQFKRSNGTSDTSVLDIQPDGDVILYNDAGTSQDLFWDASASRLGLGTTLPATDLHIGDGTTATPTLTLQSTTTGSTRINMGDSGSYLAGSIVYDNSNNEFTFTRGGATAYEISGTHTWYTAGGSRAMDLDGSGNLLVGTTNLNPHTSNTATDAGTVINPFGIVRMGRNQNPALSVNRITNDGLLAMWYRNGVNVGNISVTSTTTTYNTSSDVRLKDSIVDAPSASADIDAIQVRSFDWKADGSHQKYGMVAQELQTVAPDAVSEGDTEEDMMGVDYSKLVPMLVKEIQSLRARVAQLEND